MHRQTVLIATSFSSWACLCDPRLNQEEEHFRHWVHLLPFPVRPMQKPPLLWLLLRPGLPACVAPASGVTGEALCLFPLVGRYVRGRLPLGCGYQQLLSAHCGRVPVGEGSPEARLPWGVTRWVAPRATVSTAHELIQVCAFLSVSS